MAERQRARRVRHFEEIQEQRQAAMQAIHRERVIRQALDELDPQPEDIHLDYGKVLDRLTAALGDERRRVGKESDTHSV